jgi:hypothetical protein
MGVYVFQSKHGPYLKIGHYSKSNAWSRISNRGFKSILHPFALTGKVSVDDFELVYWNENMNTKDEKRLHQLCACHKVIGEWFALEAMSILDNEYKENQIHACSKEAAVSTRRRL